MADISTAVSMARVPILGEDGRISDDYIPAAIGENVTKAESAATRAESAATAAEGSASAAGQSAAQAAGSATTTQQQAAAAQGSAAAASESATAAAGSATTAQGHAQAAASSATQAAQSAQQVADKYIIGATATTLGPGEQATAQVVEQVLQLGIPQGEKGDKGNPGDKGDPGDRGDPGTAATVTVGTTQTGEPGTDASVTNSGTTSAAVLDFTIPRGEKGDKGDPGTGVPDGGTPGQLLSKTDSGTAWVDPPSTGNVLTGEAEGYVAHAEDAYPQKPREVRLKGKTWVNRWPVLSGTHNGITVATDETGLVTVTGTATADADVTADVSGWAAGKSYTTMINAKPTGCSAYFEVQKPSGNTSINATTTGATLNVASDATNCVAGVHVTSGTTVNASFRAMLVDGTEAPDCFTPCASITSVETGKLVTNGKNLLPETPSAFSTSTVGITFARNDDGSIHIEGTGTSMYPQAPIFNELHFPPGITVSAGSTTMGMAPNAYIVLYGVAGDNTQISTSRAGSSRSGTTDGKFEYYRLFVVAEGEGTLYDGDVYFWLELGSTATSYEPPTVTETPLPEVELRSLPNGTCDELVIKADGTATVERRTQLVDGEVVALDTPATEPQSSVTLPALPAPTFNQYHDADVPSDTTVTYERDINIALDNLAKQVAGTASAVAVREASTIEEE